MLTRIFVLVCFNVSIFVSGWDLWLCRVLGRV